VVIQSSYKFVAYLVVNASELLIAEAAQASFSKRNSVRRFAIVASHDGS